LDEQATLFVEQREEVAAKRTARSGWLAACQAWLLGR
jgi:hypothetical protein